MKKSILAILAIGTLPISFSHNLYALTEESPLFSDSWEIISEINLSDEIGLTIQEVQSALNNQYTSKIIQTNISSPLITREFAVFLTLQKMGISLSTTDIEKIWKNFVDVEADSFFAPYLAFAKKTEIVTGYSNNIFDGKNILSKWEFKKILKNIEGEKLKNIYKTYSELRNSAENEENITLYSAVESNKNTINIAEIYESVVNIEPFNGRILYKSVDAPIFADIDTNGEIRFPKVENINEYSLYFDYKWFPFLAKKVEKFSEKELMNDLVARVNQYRLANGIGSVYFNEKLSETASEYAKTMYDTKNFEHRDQNGRRVGDRILENGYDYSYALENLGRGHTSTEAIMNDWKNSPTHNKNLLNPNVDEIGIGFYGKYWVQIFGKEFKHQPSEYSHDV